VKYENSVVAVAQLVNKLDDTRQVAGLLSSFLEPNEMLDCI